jgi:uncharacterized membrane protein
MAMTAITIPDSLGIAATVALIILLATRELVLAHGGVRSIYLGHYLQIAIIPLLLVFALIVITKIIES